MGFSTIGMSHLSTQYYLVPVNATNLGLPYNPTGDAVAFAFMPTPTQVPGNTDWVVGSWATNAASVLFLVGPSGTITLWIGTYVAYVRITDAPEIPVEIVGQLQIS